MRYDEATYTRFWNEAKRLHPAYTDAQLHEWAEYSAAHHWNRLHPEQPAALSLWKKFVAAASGLPWSKVGIVLYRLAVLGLLCRLISK